MKEDRVVRGDLKMELEEDLKDIFEELTSIEKHSNLDLLSSIVPPKSSRWSAERMFMISLLSGYTENPINGLVIEDDWMDDLSNFILRNLVGVELKNDPSISNMVRYYKNAYSSKVSPLKKEEIPNALQIEILDLGRDDSKKNLTDILSELNGELLYILGIHNLSESEKRKIKTLMEKGYYIDGHRRKKVGPSVRIFAKTRASKMVHMEGLVDNFDLVWDGNKKKELPELNPSENKSKLKSLTKETFSKHWPNVDDDPSDSRIPSISNAKVSRALVGYCKFCEDFMPKIDTPEEIKNISFITDMFREASLSGPSEEDIKKIMKIAMTIAKFNRTDLELSDLRRATEMYVSSLLAKKKKEMMIKQGFDDICENYDPKEFERLVKELFSKMGYEAELTPHTGDKGIDVIAENNQQTVVVQVKKYKENDKVSRKEIHELNGAFSEFNAGKKSEKEKADKAIFVTSSHFTDPAKETAYKIDELELWNREDFIDKISKYHLNDESSLDRNMTMDGLNPLKIFERIRTDLSEEEIEEARVVETIVNKRGKATFEWDRCSELPAPNVHETIYPPNFEDLGNRASTMTGSSTDYPYILRGIDGVLDRLRIAKTNEGNSKRLKELDELIKEIESYKESHDDLAVNEDPDDTNNSNYKLWIDRLLRHTSEPFIVKKLTEYAKDEAEFQLGQLRFTKSIENKIKSDPDFENYIKSSLERHMKRDWGELPEEDKEIYEEALRNDDSLTNLHSIYNHEKYSQIYIITLRDHSVTTVLLPHER